MRITVCLAVAMEMLRPLPSKWLSGISSQYFYFIIETAECTLKIQPESLLFCCINNNVTADRFNTDEE
jgi:hypothetical protein